ncbi:hypothetical protein ACLKA7_012386 [Drosophila subpalustris]
MAPLCAVLQNVIRTLVRRNSAQCTKEWVNTSWQLVLSDEVGSHCSWTCVRDLRITLAIRSIADRLRFDFVTSPDCRPQ